MGQEEKHQLMKLFSMALQELGEFLSGRTALDVIAGARGSAEALAEILVAGMPFYDDINFWKRAQIVPADLALAGIAEFDDLDRLTIFADNLVPHVLRVDGVLVYDDELAEIDGRRAALGSRRGGARDPGVRGPRLRADRRARWACRPTRSTTGSGTGASSRDYKARPRHRCQTVNY